MNREEFNKSVPNFFKTNFFKDYVRRSRYLQEKVLLAELNNNIILNGEDFLLIEKFMKEHNIQEGVGFAVFMGYIINYYKINSSEVKID